jgi:hypothetical protein
MSLQFNGACRAKSNWAPAAMIVLLLGVGQAIINQQKSPAIRVRDQVPGLSMMEKVELVR